MGGWEGSFSNTEETGEVTSHRKRNLILLHISLSQPHRTFPATSALTFSVHKSGNVWEYVRRRRGQGWRVSENQWACLNHNCTGELIWRQKCKLII